MQHSLSGSLLTSQGEDIIPHGSGKISMKYLLLRVNENPYEVVLTNGSPISLCTRGVGTELNSWQQEDTKSKVAQLDTVQCGNVKMFTKRGC